MSHPPFRSRSGGGGTSPKRPVGGTAAGDLPHVGLEEAACLLLLIARDDPQKLDAAAVRFLGRACLERSFITLDDAQLLVACLAQL